jgi:uncharacterized protein YndB with AHSA1/START domain
MNPLDLHLSRTVRSTPEKVWNAWTTEAGLASWWWHTWPDTRYRIDAQVGGSYRIEAADHGIGVRGEYLELRPYERLMFTWIWIEDGADGAVENVSVTFTPDGDRVRIDLVHTGPWTTSEPVDNYRQGWDFVLGALHDAVGSAA